jgi:hypothetical protein
VVSGEVSLSGISTVEFWDWFRNPVPPANEDRDFETLRRALGMTDDQAIANGNDIDKLRQPDRARLERLKPDFGREHNPFLRHIIRRTRDFLEKEKDPETNQAEAVWTSMIPQRNTRSTACRVNFPACTSSA